MIRQTGTQPTACVPGAARLKDPEDMLLGRGGFTPREQAGHRDSSAEARVRGIVLTIFAVCAEAGLLRSKTGYF